MELSSLWRTFELLLEVIHDHDFAVGNVQSLRKHRRVEKCICQLVVPSEIEVTHLFIGKIADCPYAEPVAQLMKKAERIAPFESSEVLVFPEGLSPVNSNPAMKQGIPRDLSLIHI